MKPTFQVKKGTTRTTFLLGKYAVKIPSFYSWELFLQGLLGNIQETSFSKCRDVLLAPVLFSLPGGFLNVMPRCIVYSRGSISSEHMLSIWKAKIASREDMCYFEFVELKHDSIGLYKGKVVAIDYGDRK